MKSLAAITRDDWNFFRADSTIALIFDLPDSKQQLP